MNSLSILYRGPLSSCNYACPYCPFAKHVETDEEHAADARALERFVDWCELHTNRELSVFFTPWGEALVRTRYQKAIARLTHLPHVAKIAAQTNGSFRPHWVDNCDKSRLGLWITFHPEETQFDRFVTQIESLLALGVRLSVGVVGMKEHFEAIERLRERLPREVYIWVNAFKRVEGYYSQDEVEFLRAIDHLFEFNNVRHPSLGRTCRAGENVISVDGDGNITRCHFVKTSLGNIYQDDLDDILRPRLCTNQTCGCHIGYVHMDDLGLYKTFGKGILERIPT
ncbi:radical SAM/SPASM domain-containing protein [bacterium]|nr:MAG: radical SAM/SPASM domain-containing protein [bacterium]